MYGVGKPTERAYVYRKNPRSVDDSGIGIPTKKNLVPITLDIDYNHAPWIKYVYNFVTVNIVDFVNH